MSKFDEIEKLLSAADKSVENALSLLDETGEIPAERPTVSEMGTRDSFPTPFGEIRFKGREKWTEDQNRKFVELRAQGLPLRTIGQMIGKSESQCIDKMKVLNRKYRNNM